MNNPPAFPSQHPPSYLEDPHTGMTLRDYFASAAMQGMLADNESRGTYEDFAVHSFAYADAMLKARKK